MRIIISKDAGIISLVGSLIVGSPERQVEGNLIVKFPEHQQHNVTPRLSDFLGINGAM